VNRSMVRLAAVIVTMACAGFAGAAVVAAPGAVARLLDDCIRASGGPELEAVQTETRKGTLTRGPDGPAPFEVVARPGKWRYSQVFAWGDQQSFGFDGTRGWVADTRSVEPMEARQLLDLQVLWDPRMPLRLGELFPTMEVTGTEKTETGEVTWVRATSREGVAVELAFERPSGLLVQVGDLRLEDYRAVNGVMRPFRVRLGENMVMTLSEIRHGEKVDDSVFDRPSCVLQAKEAPLYRPEKHIQVSTAAMDACVGEYETPDGQKLQVTRKDNHLIYRSPRRSFELLANSETVFVRGYSNLEFHFVKDPAGAVTSLVLVMPDRRIEAKKVK
jgi:hypothetical protein